MIEEKNKNIKLLVSLLLVFVLIFIIIGASYAAFYYKKEGKIRNVISTRSVQCTFNEGTPIYIKSAFPISDEVGKILMTDTATGYEQGYYDATISCECKGSCRGNYEIYLTDTTNKDSTIDKIDDKYIKTYVTNGNELEQVLSPVKTLDQLETATTNDDKVIYKGDFAGTFSQKIRLRLWIGEDYPVGEKVQTFKAKINAKISE